MFHPIAALTLAFLPLAVRATPLFADAAFVVSKFPVSDIVLTPTPGNLTLEALGLHSNATVPSVLITCTEANCGGNCDFTGLPTAFNTCEGLPVFNSVAVSQQFNEALAYGVFVGPSGCASFAHWQIPAINTCFNINGGPIQVFEITE
ncbi:hypothetical protein C8Q76DRAFT_631777 [Earliella scabrosa]|nr:hypothetical protein C8Q76DRAFT_631777 [Earliella scabrosa]